MSFADTFLSERGLALTPAEALERASVTKYHLMLLCFAISKWFSIAAYSEVNAYLFPSWQIALGASHEQLAMVFGAQQIAAIYGTLHAGSLADRRGRTTVLVWFTFATVLGGLISVVAPDMTTLIIGRLVLGTSS